MILNLNMVTRSENKNKFVYGILTGKYKLYAQEFFVVVSFQLHVVTVFFSLSPSMLFLVPLLFGLHLCGCYFWLMIFVFFLASVSIPIRCRIRLVSFHVGNVFLTFTQFLLNVAVSKEAWLLLYLFTRIFTNLCFLVFGALSSPASIVLSYFFSFLSSSFSLTSLLSCFLLVFTFLNFLPVFFLHLHSCFSLLILYPFTFSFSILLYIQFLFAFYLHLLSGPPHDAVLDCDYDLFMFL